MPIAKKRLISGKTANEFRALTIFAFASILALRAPQTLRPSPSQQ